MVLESYFSVSVFSLVVIIISTLMFVSVFSFKKNARAIAIPFFVSLTILIEMAGTILVQYDLKMAAGFLLIAYYIAGGFTGWSTVIAFDWFAKIGLFKNRARRLLLALPAVAVLPFCVYDLISDKFELVVFSVEFGLSGIVSTIVLAAYFLFTGILAFVSAKKVMGSQRILFFAFGGAALIPFIFMFIGFFTQTGMEYRWFPYALMVLTSVLFIFRFKITLDGLTGIKNRAAFDEDIKDKVNNSNRYPSVYLMYLDVNYFKKINDSYGHDVGDKALILFGKTLHNEAEAMNADAFRLGGDEFGVIFCHHTKKEIDEFIRKVSEKVSNNDFNFNFSFSYGTAKYAKGMSITDFLNAADKEMYDYKRIIESNLSLEK